MNNNGNALYLKGSVFTKGQYSQELWSGQKEPVGGENICNSVATFQKMLAEKEWPLVSQIGGLILNSMSIFCLIYTGGGGAECKGGLVSWHNWDFLCVRMCVDLHGCVCWCCDSLRLTSSVFLITLHTLRQGLQLNLELTGYASLASKLNPLTPVPSKCNHSGWAGPPSFMCVLRSQLWSSCLCATSLVAKSVF